MKRTARVIVGVSLAAVVAGCAQPGDKQPAPPLADIHLHFKWDQKEVISADEAIARLRDNNVVLAVVSGEPSATALELAAAGGDWVIPIFSPYIEHLSRYDWYRDPRVVQRAREGLRSGQYRGIGEVHLIAGNGPTAENEVVRGLFRLAAEFDVPLLLHTDASDGRYFARICQAHPDVRFLWAHAGGYLEADHVQGVIENCPNVWVEFSARDPWHYGTLVEDSGALRAGWLAVLQRYPDRFMVGSDPVWNAHQAYRWYEADEGWFHLDELIGFHRSWLSTLPSDLEERIRLTNAKRFFGVE